ncbi:hypothetical protein FB45DRAFT_822585 [Roridomyces roridus]|uniref:G-patch domain-containing protein n=1 Tax=Roridomyces roridus TaxID=1738132 RepID=A0AAD7FX26_9AGAR|nr:hypothetical protein FB45DRAFT_822585 [Roridomyces roridus]
MGLSGRKVKQRIGADPRNLAWADDAAKFGTSYLSKFGWDASKGLGAEGEGRLSHIKVSQKLDMLGIGAAQQRDPNGIAWKQNKDFERLLERLNASSEAESVKEEAGDVEIKEEDEPAKKKRRKSEPDEVAKLVVPRHRSHRARAIAAKNMSSKSAASISEILGIAPTPSTATPEGTLTPCGEVPDEKITTSTKSLADYFKDKLLAKTGKSEATTPARDLKAETDYEAPRGGLGSSRVKLEPQEDRPSRMGLSSTLAASFFAATAVVVKEEEVDVDEVKKEKKKREEKEDSKRKEKKGKRDEEPAEETSEKKKKRKRRDEEEAETVNEDERKRAKKERKRLKALKKLDSVVT